jgi:hypothetical protein
MHLYRNIQMTRPQPSLPAFELCIGFLFDIVSRPALGATHSPIQWVPGTLSLGVKQPEREADHSSPSSAEVKECVELYILSPIRLHGVMLS